MARLHGKVAVITGGSSGIGLATAKRFAEEGAEVFLTGRRQVELDRAVKEIGRSAVAIQADVTKLADLKSIVDDVKNASGRIDVLVFNAAFAEFMPLAEISEEHYGTTFDTNVRAVVFGMQEALPLLSDGASVIIVGSVAASRAIPNMSLYAATKGALRSLARNWVLELKDRGIRVNVLSPGNISTPALDRLVPVEFQEQAFLQGPLLRRLGKPSEIADVALFLASDESSFINGSEILADGGLIQV